MMRPIVLVAHICFLGAYLPANAVAASLAQQAAALRSKAIANIAALKTVTFEVRMTTSAAGSRATFAHQATRGTVRWDRGKRKLKWIQPDQPSQGFVVDSGQRTLFLLSGTTTTFDDSLTESEAAELGRPKPGWLWQPEWFLPASPATVREDGSALVVTTDSGTPRREIWLDRSSGFVLKFTDTDTTGKQTRVVECHDWRRVDGVWLPGSVTERVAGVRGGFVRTIEFIDLRANVVLPEGTFELP